MSAVTVPWLKEAEKHLGFHEGPNNANPFGKHYHLDNEPWCALFVSYCCEKSGNALPSMQPGMPDGYASVYYGMQWAKAHGYFHPSWKAEAGWAICYGWDGPSSSAANMHTGLVVSSGPRDSVGHTIEGNRSDQVERQTFIVGSTVVLGCIDIPSIVADIKGKRRKPVIHPQPQPRHPKHPHNSGPHRSAFYRAWLRFVRRWKKK